MNYINTEFVYPPIPERHSDWAATFDGYDGAPDAKGPSAMIGRGPTESAAIKDLLDQYDEWLAERGKVAEQLGCNMCRNEVTTDEAVHNSAMCGPCRSARDDHYRDTER